MIQRQVPIALLSLAIAVGMGGRVTGQTGTFIDRQLSEDLRVVSYNILNNSIFPDVNLIQAQKFGRVVNALDADIWNLQELTRPPSDVVDLLNGLQPLPGGATWHAHVGGDNTIVSKYPLSLTATTTIPNGSLGFFDQVGLALVDLPDATFPADLYIMNGHFKCCGNNISPDIPSSEEFQRQEEADALANWMRDARTPGGFIDLPAETPMMVVGDLNIVNDPGLLDPLGTLLSGDIFDEATFGPDSPPDWDGTSLADAHPLHNVGGPADYTWRNDLGSFDPGRLDYILYTDSILEEAHKFVLNTVDMTAGELAATGLQEFDITVDLVGQRFDHLPVVVDFRFLFEPLPGDGNGDDIVDAADYTVWANAFGQMGIGIPGDYNGDEVVDTADYTIWANNFGQTVTAPAGTSAAVPEPSTFTLAGLSLMGLIAYGRRRRTRKP